MKGSNINKIKLLLLMLFTTISLCGESVSSTMHIATIMDAQSSQYQEIQK